MAKTKYAVLRKLVNWKCRKRNDSSCYSIRARTRKEAKAQRERDGVDQYDPPEKIVIEYTNAYDLMLQLTSEESNDF